MTDTCQDCKYLTADTLNAAQGSCRRFPPQMFPITLPAITPEGQQTIEVKQCSDFPTTKRTSWCGEFKRAVTIN